MKINFTTPVYSSDQFQSKALRAVNAFDDYFYLRGRKAVVIADYGDNIFNVQYNDNPQKCHLALTVLKVISYATGIVPLIMLIGKAIARHQCKFLALESFNTDAEDIPSEQSQLVEDIPQLPPREANVINAHQALAQKAFIKCTVNKPQASIIEAIPTFQPQRIERFLTAESLNAQQISSARLKLTKDLRMTLKSVHEFVRSEKSHLMEMRKQMRDIRNDPVLNKFTELKFKEEFPHFLISLQKHIECGESFVNKMESIAEYLQITEEECKKTDFVDPNNLSIIKNRTIHQSKQDILKLTEIISSEEFENYLKHKTDIVLFNRRFNMDDKLEKNILVCTLCAQRIGRYNLTLTETRKLLLKINFIEEEKLLRKVKCITYVPLLADLVTEGMITYNESKQGISLLNWLWGTQGKIQIDFEQLCMNSQTPTIEKLKIWGQLVAIAAAGDLEKSQPLLDKFVLDNTELEKLKKLEMKFRVIIYWINDKVQKKKIRQILPGILVKINEPRLKELMSKNEKYLSEAEKEELQKLKRQLKKSQEHPSLFDSLHGSIHLESDPEQSVKNHKD